MRLRVIEGIPLEQFAPAMPTQKHSKTEAWMNLFRDCFIDVIRTEKTPIRRYLIAILLLFLAGLVLLSLTKASEYALTLAGLGYAGSLLAAPFCTRRRRQSPLQTLKRHVVSRPQGNE